VTLDVIVAKLADLAERVEMVRKHRRAAAADYETQPEARDLVAFNLMLAVQSAADLATHLIMSEGWVPARSVGEAFDRIAERGVIATDVAARLRRAVGFRNLVAHGYAKLHSSGLHDAAWSGVEDLDQFAKQIASWAQQHYP
jgi:uncharacterized protein YutE (UPF0331/DUF86 family)